jgi:hypothetical protein
MKFGRLLMVRQQHIMKSSSTKQRTSGVSKNETVAQLEISSEQ